MHRSKCGKKDPCCPQLPGIYSSALRKLSNLVLLRFCGDLIAHVMLIAGVGKPSGFSLQPSSLLPSLLGTVLERSPDLSDCLGQRMPITCWGEEKFCSCSLPWGGAYKPGSRNQIQNICTIISQPLLSLKTPSLANCHSVCLPFCSSAESNKCH